MPELTNRAEIEIAQEHIGEGEPHSAFQCPIALGLRERFPRRDIAVFQDDHEIRIITRNHAERTEFDGIYAGRRFRRRPDNQVRPRKKRRPLHYATGTPPAQKEDHAKSSITKILSSANLTRTRMRIRHSRQTPEPNQSQE